MYPFSVSFKMSLCSAILLLCLVIHVPLLTDACLQHERSYLLDFKDGLNVSSSPIRNLSSWRGFNCCEWEGVGCDYHTSHVIHLDLSTSSEIFKNGEFISDSYSKKEFRPSLFKLEHLQHLDLTGNDFQGISIPPHFSKLQRLTFLSLSDAGFCGEVPLELGNMSSLLHLDISSNYYEPNGLDYESRIKLKSSKFDVWVKNLRSLEFLVMDGVDLSMAISEQWGESLNSLLNLTQIHLSECQLSGNIPDLSNLTHLSDLDMGWNFFPFELPSWFENISSLVSLDLTSCGLNGSIPSNFMWRSRLNNLVLDENVDLTGNISFILSHSSSLVELSLDMCSLEGELPRSLANFSKLELMDLSHNNLQGSLPSSFGSFLPLGSLDLRHNYLLSGQIPPSLCQLPKLWGLILGYNNLSGTIPDCISNMASLEILSVPSNGLSGNFSLQLFQNLSRLMYLDLSENELFIDMSKSWVPQFAQLESLGLRSCNIEGNLPEFLSQQYRLETLDLSNNKIVGNLPFWLWDLPELRFLNLSNNQLEGCLSPKISNRLQMVDLHGNRLYGSLPSLDFVAGILDLSDNEFNGSIPAAIGSSFFVKLSGNNLTGEIPHSVCEREIVSNQDYDGVLDLSKNKLSGTIPTNIGRCSKLYVLKLAQNVLQGEIPNGLGNLTTLRSLNLNGNKLQGIVPPSIANCINLQVFDLGNNKFEGNVPVWIEKLTDLKILSLVSNKFIGRIPPQLFRMHHLQILELHGNQLSGSIPPDVSKLHAMLNSEQSVDVQYSQSSIISYFIDMKSSSFFVDEVTVWIKGRATQYQKIIAADKFIDLSNNKLSGTIPSQMGLLKGLISLNMSRNNLSGSIPESLGALTHLESLDLSDNNLSGKISSQLLNLTFLAVLNLSDNMLSGLIPQGKQFSIFEPSSFLNNPNLHGPPLENGTRSSGLNNTQNQNITNVVDGDGDVVMDLWWGVAVGLSYGVGFATVIAVLSCHIKWRYMCFAQMDNLIYYLLEW